MKSSHTGNLMDKFLSGLSDFGQRSLNLSVMVNDQSLREAYATAETSGELPTNRARVLILGEPRAGKTSLLNRLLGREFNIGEQPTQGIETLMCHVTNVDKQWNESRAARADDIRECASAVAVQGEVLSGRIQKEGTESKNRLTKYPKASASDTSDDSLGSSGYIKKVLRLSQLGAIVCILFVLGMFQYGYFMFVGSCIGAMTMVLDYNNAYRFATSMSFVCILFEAMLRMDQPLERPVCKTDEETPSYQAIHFTQNILTNFMITAMVGVATGLGFRTGIAVAFSASVHPSETSLTSETIIQGLGASWNKLLPITIFGIGGFLGFSSYIYCTANDRWHIRRTCVFCSVMLLFVAVYLKLGYRYQPFLYIFLNGFLMIAGHAWGSIFGRRAVLKYGFEASYVTKKTAGFLFGLYLTHECGWSLKIPDASILCLAFYIMSVIAHPVFDLHNSYRIWRFKPAFPVKLIRQQMKASVRGQPLLETKLSLWDFAGDALYHCAHHIFMPDRALYIIVFNLEVAVSDEDGQLQKLLFWLHSVCVHARHPDAVIMIVGTHTASVSKASRLRFADKLHRRISSPFCHRLVLNPRDDKPLFLVENTEPIDRDFQHLRAEIFRRVENAEYAQEKYPIKYLRFYEEIQKRRKLAELDIAENIMTLQQARDLARETCSVTGKEELKKLLLFFCEAGEVIYKDDDEVLRQHVVLDPQFLVDIMRKLVQIPRGSDRSHRYAVEWRNYESSGIISEDLLKHIYGNMPHLVPLLTHFLRAYDLMCPVTPIVSPNCSKRSFLVPTMLPPYRGDPEKFWESLGDDEVFYFDFGVFDPSTIYYRLLTRCLSHTCLDKNNSNSQPLIFADRCRFHIGASVVFKFQLERRSSQQMLLSVTVLTFEQENPSGKLLKFLLEVVRSITARDYPHLRFTFGPRCPFCVCPADSSTSKSDGKKLIDGSSDDSSLKEAIHVLKMAAHDQPFPTKSPVVMLCGQRRHELQTSRCTFSGSKHSSSNPSRRVAFNTKTPITKIPSDLFGRVCSLLNNPSGSRNWKTLAGACVEGFKLIAIALASYDLSGELGKDVEFVAELDCSVRVANPTEYLLREWAMTEGGVTVADLLEVLDRPSLHRTDIISLIRAQVTTERHYFT